VSPHGILSRFSTYRQRNLVFSAKRNLKNHKDNVFITENLTPRRRKIMDELNYLRVSYFQNRTRVGYFSLP
jgi:hypothetical protein